MFSFIIKDLNNDKRIDFDEFKIFISKADNLLQIEVPGRSRFLHLNTTADVAVRTLFAGGVAGCVSRSVVSPLERLKILFQTQSHAPGVQVKYNSVSGALRTIWKEEGLAGMFRGNGLNCVRIFPTSAIQFYSYDVYKSWYAQLLKKPELTSPVERLVAGGAAGVTALVATYPLDFLRARVSIVNRSSDARLWPMFVNVVRNEGPLALYRGLWPSMLGVIPYVGMDFACYDTLKRIVPRRPDGTIDPLWTLTCGACGGTVGQTVSYPLELVRRRLQVQNINESITGSAGHHQRYRGMSDALIKIYKQEGIAGYYRGLWPNYLKVIPSISSKCDLILIFILIVSFLVYEEMRTLLNLPSKH
jgi:solute carrier family 25 phosphate transporter 23/24/25/41